MKIHLLAAEAAVSTSSPGTRLGHAAVRMGACLASVLS
jgi:hypothetical protein